MCCHGFTASISSCLFRHKWLAMFVSCTVWSNAVSHCTEHKNALPNFMLDVFFRVDVSIGSG